jgi:protein phosphatase
MRSEDELKITLGGRTDVGRVREKNEDSFVAMTINEGDRGSLGVRAVLVVADGMGGHVGGDVASRTAIRVVMDALRPSGYSRLETLGDTMQDAVAGVVRRADERVRESGGGGDKPPGTTFTSVFVTGNRAYIGHVGDSRAYHIRNDEIVPVTEDHSFVGKLIREGKLTPEEAKDFPQKNIILRSLGAGEPVTVDEPEELFLQDGDILFLCSDGLWDLVSEDEILGAFHGERSIQKACDRLVDLANFREGHDNITAVAALFGKFHRNRALALAMPRSGPITEKIITEEDAGGEHLHRGPESINVRTILMTAVGVLCLVFVFLVSYVAVHLAQGDENKNGASMDGSSPLPATVIEPPTTPMPGPVTGPEIPAAPGDELDSGDKDPGGDGSGEVSSATDDPETVGVGGAPPADPGGGGTLTPRGDGQF